LRFTHLNETNYPEWIIRMEARLIQAGLWEHLVHMRARDPYVIWEELRRVHVARGFATRLALRRRFIRLMKIPEENMATWIGHVKAFSYRLQDLSVEATDEDRILVLTNGLDESYETFVITLDGMAANSLTLDTVVDRMISEEMRRTDSTVVKPKSEAYVIS
ncbi:hypothetical protein M422DRAFT_84536, partial [Sphaerobolus stellatus SS14]